MEQRFYYDEFLEEIYDEQIDDYPTNRTICEILNNQSQRIAELEEQLKNSRVKFFLGYDSEFNMVVKELNLNFILPAWMHNKDFRFYDTQKEAQAKLEELKGE